MAYTTIKELFTAICDAIRGKDGTTDKINHQDIPSRISAITTGGTGIDTTIASNGASASDIISGKKAWVNNELITGTHTCQGGTDISDASTVSSDQVASGITVYGQNGKVTGTHECSEVEEIPTVEQAAPSITVSSSGLITASVNQSEGYVAGGTKFTTKQLTTKETATYTPGTSDQTIAASTYLTGTQTIKGDVNLLASNIKNGVSIFGITGSYEGETSSSVPVYRWGKYNITSSGYQLNEKTGNVSVKNVMSSGAIVYKNMTTDTSTGKITLSDPYSETASAWSKIYEVYSEYPYYWVTENTVAGKITAISTSSGTLGTQYNVSYTSYEMISSGTEKGSYIEDVYHISSSAFPEDGVQDGYWYVSQGETTE